MDFLELSKARYSCRKFSDRRVPRELLDKILEAGIAAPSERHTQRKSREELVEEL